MQHGVCNLFAHFAAPNESSLLPDFLSIQYGGNAIMEPLNPLGMVDQAVHLNLSPNLLLPNQMVLSILPSRSPNS